MPLEEAWILAGIILKIRDEFLGDRECSIDVCNDEGLLEFVFHANMELTRRNGGNEES